MALDLSEQQQKDILERFQTDPNAFEEIYNFYFESILKYLAQRTMSADIAYDLTSDTFLKAYNSFHKFRWNGVSIRSWVYRIASNVLKDHYRQSKPNHVCLDDVEGHPALVADTKGELEALDQALFGDERLKEVHAGLQNLNSKYQQVVSLYFFSGLSQAEIGTVLGKNESSVKAMIFRAVEQLRLHVHSNS